MASSASANLRRIAQQAKPAPRLAVEDGTKQFRKAIEKSLKQDTGGDNRLSGAPTRMRVQVKVDGQTIVTGKVTPNKPAMSQWVWLTEGTGDPGPTAPKGTWSDPVKAEMSAVQKTMRDRIEQVMR